MEPSIPSAWAYAGAAAPRRGWFGEQRTKKARRADHEYPISRDSLLGRIGVGKLLSLRSQSCEVLLSRSTRWLPAPPPNIPFDLLRAAAVSNADCLGARSPQADIPVCPHRVEDAGRLPAWTAHDCPDKRWLHLDCRWRLASV